MVMGNIPQQEIQQIPHEQQVQILYTNWRGETSNRTIIPERIYFGSTQWHPEKQWLLQAYDVQKGEWRDFAIKDIAKWQSTTEQQGK